MPLPAESRPPAAAVVLTEEVVRVHQRSVWRYLVFLGADREVATELTQDVFLVLLRAHLPERGPGALRRWLRGTAKNLYLASRRQLRHELTGQDPEVLEAAWADYEQGDDGAGYRAALRGCLGKLPADQRAAVESYWGERRDLRGLARTLGVEVEGARSFLRRTKAALRHCIERSLRRDHF